MEPALTVKSQVTLPKAIREHLGVGPGDRVAFEPLPDGTVRLRPAADRSPAKDPLKALRGAATRRVRTEAVMRATRGDDWRADRAGGGK
jgi:AbrB family looped-hinge helix DNA binding protein